MVLIIILCCFFVQNFLAMGKPFHSITTYSNGRVICTYQHNWIDAFEPTEQAQKYEVLKKTNLQSSDLPEEKQEVFRICMDLIHADNLKLDFIKYILDDAALMEAIIAYAPMDSRDSFIRLFFTGALMYEKVDAYSFFLKHHVYATDIRLGGCDETPAEFVRSLTKNIKVN